MLNKEKITSKDFAHYILNKLNLPKDLLTAERERIMEKAIKIIVEELNKVEFSPN